MLILLLPSQVCRVLWSATQIVSEHRIGCRTMASGLPKILHETCTLYTRLQSPACQQLPINSFKTIAAGSKLQDSRIRTGTRVYLLHHSRSCICTLILSHALYSVQHKTHFLHQNTETEAELCRRTYMKPSYERAHRLELLGCGGSLLRFQTEKGGLLKPVIWPFFPPFLPLTPSDSPPLTPFFLHYDKIHHHRQP